MCSELAMKLQCAFNVNKEEQSVDFEIVGMKESASVRNVKRRSSKTSGRGKREQSNEKNET